MTGNELLKYLRVDVLRDNALPYLWSDNLILTYLSEAESKFARMTYAILDETKTITTVIGQSTYTIPTGTLFVESAAISTESGDLINFTRKRIPSNLLTATGTPMVFVCDQATNKMRLYPVPDTVITINLRVARLPSDPITKYSEPELDSHYHLDLAEYVAWRCLQSNDVDGESAKASSRHMADWNQRVSDAKREIYRQRLGNNPNATSNWTGKRK